jgi:hypothetical protein
MRLHYPLICVFLLVSIIPLDFVTADQSNEDELFTLYGNIYDEEGSPALETSMKLIPRGSIWASDGTYSIEDITEGEHTVRAYFMNNGHTVAYRQIYIDSDTQLDWHVGKNWVTGKVYQDSGQLIEDSALTSVKLVDYNESATPENGRISLGPYEIGNYYTVRAYYGDIDHSTQYVHFKMQSGSATEFDVNDFHFHHGKNSRYGFVKDSVGNAMSGVSVSDGNQTVATNTDGFYLLENLDVGSESTITFMHDDLEIAPPITELITTGEGWLNNTATIEINLPGNASFTTQVQVIENNQPFLIEWNGGAYTESYSLYRNGVIAYSGQISEYTFTPQGTGNYEFTLVAENMNGTTTSFKSLVLMVLPEQSNSDLWAVGMHWNYSVDYFPSSDSQNITMTAIGKETVTDAFGIERDSFLVRMTGSNYDDEEKSYRWVDTSNLLYLHTYWEDDPDSSSYFQEGYLGWNFTDENGIESDLLSSNDDLNLHFNRTNIIGVPGHPNGYDDTFNLVEITQDVEISTQAGTFSTTYFCITDNNDGVKSWELWYNETVRNWVKKIDRLPGSHSDSVIMELTSFEVPVTPQFITEDSNISEKDFVVQWAPFQGAISYELLQDGDLIYSGADTSFELQNSQDGQFIFQINAKLSESYLIEGDSLTLDVLYVLPSPVLSASEDVISSGDEVMFAWEPVEESIWYSVIVYDSQGWQEIYNGSETDFSTSELEIGLNRVRINTGSSDGKISEFSDSIFVTVEESDKSDASSLGEFVQPLALFAIIAIIMVAVLIFDKGE